MSIPVLYSTEKVPLQEKTVFEHWFLSTYNFHWLIAELDTAKNLAFGYAYLNDEQNAEWGYISLTEIQKIGAAKDASFEPTKAQEAIKEILGVRK